MRPAKSVARFQAIQAQPLMKVRVFHKAGSLANLMTITTKKRDIELDIKRKGEYIIDSAAPSFLTLVHVANSSAFQPCYRRDTF